MFFLRNLKRWQARYNIKRSPARRTLEYRILPYFLVNEEFRRILLVGTASFTRHYDLFFAGKEAVYTIDNDPRFADYGIRGRHIIDSIENIDRHFDEGYFDCVLMNGIYGWGLDEKEALEKSLRNIRKVLRSGGVLLFGWNKVRDHDPLNLDSERYFRDFDEFKGLGKSRIEIPSNASNHIFSFYQKPNTGIRNI